MFEGIAYDCVYWHLAQEINVFECTAWLAHLARHAPRNSRVKYAVGSNLTASTNP